MSAIQFKPYQWSIKLDNGEIYVVQTDTTEELALVIEEIKTKFLPNKEIDEVMQTSVPSPVAVKPALVCQVCGGKAEIKEGISKAGNAYKVFLCLTNPELTEKGGHSHFQR